MSDFIAVVVVVVAVYCGISLVVMYGPVFWAEPLH